MPYFLRDMSLSHLPPEVWYVDDDVAYDASHHDPESGISRCFRADPGKTAWDKMAAQTPWLQGENQFFELQHPEGIHYPRIARPLARGQVDAGPFSPNLHTEPEVVAASWGQARSLLRQLERICQTVEPRDETFDAFGHDIRNVLLLACMEVETHWRGVLVANGARKRHFSTRDYVVLADILRLRDYAVRFPSFPTLAPIRPFDGWGASESTTGDLPWYAAYNAVKHNREDDFARASLRHALQAMSACAVMLRAQYGEHGLGYGTDLSHFFHVVEAPLWAATDCYYDAFKAGAPSQTHLRLKAFSHPALEAIQDKPTSTTGSTSAAKLA